MSITNPQYSNINHEEMAAAIGLKVKHIPILIESFLEEAGPIVENLKISIDSSDYTTIKTLAHSLKGSAGNLQFLELYEMAKEMELSAIESDDNFDYAGYFEAMKNAIATIKV